MSDISNLVEMANSRPAGNREAPLSAEVRESLDAFVEALKDEGKTEATARSYRSYMVTAFLALARGEGWDDFTSDVRSACRAYARLIG